VPTRTVNDTEYLFLKQMLGVLALPKDTINDLRAKYYEGVLNGTIVMGGGGGGTRLRYASPLLNRNTGQGNSWISLEAPGAVTSDSSGPSAVGGNPTGIPISLSYAIPIDRLAVRITTAGGAGATMRVGIFNSSADGKVTTQVVDSGPLAAAAIGVPTNIITPVTVPAGDYFLVSTCSDPAIRYSGWKYPNWSAGNGRTAAAFGHSNAVFKDSGDYAGAWRNDLTSVTWINDDGGVAGIPVIQAHLTGDPT
jgi:hypothetical protein